MRPEEFVIWMAGVVDVVGKEGTPTPDQWATIRAKLGEVLAAVIKQRLLETELLRSAKPLPQVPHPIYVPSPPIVDYPSCPTLTTEDHTTPYTSPKIMC